MELDFINTMSDDDSSFASGSTLLSEVPRHQDTITVTTNGNGDRDGETDNKPDNDRDHDDSEISVSLRAPSPVQTGKRVAKKVEIKEGGAAKRTRKTTVTAEKAADAPVRPRGRPRKNPMPNATVVTLERL